MTTRPSWVALFLVGVTLALVATACGGSSGPGRAPDAGGPSLDAAADGAAEVAQAETGIDRGADADASPADVARDGDAGRAADATADAAPDMSSDEARDIDARADVAEVDGGCGPVGDATFFVDPVGGGDDDGHTGALGCPVRSVTRALALIKRQRAATGTTPDTKIEIVNGAATSPPKLSAATGELFMLLVPAGVTITAADPDGPTPVFTLASTDTHGIEFSGLGWRLSHVDLECAGGIVGIEDDSGSGTIDHVVVQHCGHGVLQEKGTVTFGPGFVSTHNMWGIKVQGGAATVVGGHGAEHTSISANTSIGVWLHGDGPSPASIDIRGPAIAPNAPDVNDIAIDGNGDGVFFDAGPTTAVLIGVELRGNRSALTMNSAPGLMLRGSYLAGNQQSALSYNTSEAPDPVDLGGDGTANAGRNVFSTTDQAANVNTSGALCVGAIPAGHTLRAAGNIFRGIDCLTGGSLLHAPTCGSQVDVAGASAIDVGACTIHD